MKIELLPGESIRVTCKNLRELLDKLSGIRAAMGEPEALGQEALGSLFDELDALRAENAQLRKVLATMQLAEPVRDACGPTPCSNTVCDTATDQESQQPNIELLSQPVTIGQMVCVLSALVATKDWYAANNTDGNNAAIRGSLHELVESLKAGLNYQSLKVPEPERFLRPFTPTAGETIELIRKLLS